VTTGPGTGRVSTSETVRGLLAALNTPRTPAPPESSVTLSRNAKGDTQWEITARGEDVFRCEQDAREMHDRLLRAYPHSSMLEAPLPLKDALDASIAEQKAAGEKQARAAAAIARNRAKR
jgi:hypothetical protein